MFAPPHSRSKLEACCVLDSVMVWNQQSTRPHPACACAAWILDLCASNQHQPSWMLSSGLCMCCVDLGCVCERCVDQCRFGPEPAFVLLKTKAILDLVLVRAAIDTLRIRWSWSELNKTNSTAVFVIAPSPPPPLPPVAVAARAVCSVCPSLSQSNKKPNELEHSKTRPSYS